MLLAAVPAVAQDARPISEPVCFSASSDAVSMKDMLPASSRWECDEKGWDNTQALSWIRFDASTWEGQPPRYFYTRISRFQHVEIAVLDTDGSVRSATYPEAAGKPVAAGPIFALPLPPITEKTAAVVVKIAAPHNANIITEARLTDSLQNADWSTGQLMILALILGMLVSPLMFDVNFFLVLRERFIVMHAYMAFAMVLYVLFAGGLMPLFLKTSVAVMAVGAALTWVIGISASAFFMLSFLERNAMPQWLRQTVYWTGWWTLTVIGFAALQFRWTQPFDNQLYFLAFIPVIAIYVLAIATALWRGSRAVRFIAVAWVPLLIAAAERLARGLGLYAAPSVLDQALYIGLALEVNIVVLGVADKYLAIRRERDGAVADAQAMERISERDPLTGLLNRRVLDQRFADFRSSGYDTFALFDLDHFKRVNDRYGHEVGDQVLKIVAGVLSADPEMVVIRMGGEEFLVLAKGKHADQRIERMRQVIPVRVAREVDVLDAMQTASVGMVTLGENFDGFSDFVDIYRSADEMLYEAKASGRNLLAGRVFENKPKPVAQPGARKTAT